MAKKTEEGTKVKKVDMMRDAFATQGYDVPLEDTQKFILEKYGVELTKAHISQTKTSERKKKGVKGKRGRKKADATATVDMGVASNLDIGDVLALFADIQRYKDRLGAKNVKKVVEKALS